MTSRSADVPAREGHEWKLVELGPPGHEPPWGDWYRCDRCGEGARSAGAPSTTRRVFDGLFSCEEKRAYDLKTAARKAGKA